MHYRVVYFFNCLLRICLLTSVFSGTAAFLSEKEQDKLSRLTDYLVDDPSETDSDLSDMVSNPSEATGDPSEAAELIRNIVDAATQLATMNSHSSTISASLGLATEVVRHFRIEWRWKIEDGWGAMNDSLRRIHK